MSIFAKIDNKLIAFSIKINAVLTKDRPLYPEIIRTFEERRIDWVENGIRKAVIIQPTFESTGVNSSIWNFINIAWIEKNGIPQKPGWQKNLIDKSGFTEIEIRIDELLKKSEENLHKVTIENVA